jgi:hypothetical protein
VGAGSEGVAVTEDHRGIDRLGGGPALSAAAGDADLAREIERVADRLRVLGPRFAARLPARTPATGPADHDPGDGSRVGSGKPGTGPGESFETQTIRTLEQIRGVLQVLADLAADAEGRPRRPVPALAPHGLGDQVLVLGHDLLAVPDPDARVAGLGALTDLRRSL